MDTFIDKLSSKRNAQEMIRANAAAEAAENERLKKEIDVYKQCLQEMRQISLQNTSTAGEVEELVRKSTEKIEAIRVEASKSDEVLEAINTNQEAITETISTGCEELKTELKAEFKTQEENVHKECVKVYRNVQASVAEENEKQTAEIIASQGKLKKKATAALVMGILAMSFAALGVVLSVLDIIGLWDFLNFKLF